MKPFHIWLIVISVFVGYCCSHAGDVAYTFDDAVSKANEGYQRQEQKIDKLINIFEDWKEKDTAKK